jgi:hypothetical protein
LCRWCSYQYWNVLCFPLIFSCCSWLHLIRPLLINFGLKAVSLSCTQNLSSGGARDPKIQRVKRLHFHFVLSEDVWFICFSLACRSIKQKMCFVDVKEDSVFMEGWVPWFSNPWSLFYWCCIGTVCLGY